MSMAEKRACKAALSANHGYEASSIFMTMWQSMGLMSLIFRMTFWQDEFLLAMSGNVRTFAASFEEEEATSTGP